MMKFTIKILNLLALLGSVAWLVKNPDWEPLVTALVLLGTYLGLEISDQKKISNPDKELFEKFLVELQPDGPTINFLRHQDIGAPFESNELNELDNFIRHWDDASHEFHNKKLDKKRRELYDKIKIFLSKLSLKVFPSHHEGWLTMDIEDMEMDKKKIQARDELNEMATKVHYIYQDLVRIGRKMH